jgi:hypothetical protein
MTSKMGWFERGRVEWRASSAMTGTVQPFYNYNFKFASEQRRPGRCIFDNRVVYTNIALRHRTKNVIIRLRAGRIPA